MEYNKKIQASIISGIAEVTTTYPIDYLKTIRQANKPLDIFWSNPYRGSIPRIMGLIPMRIVFWNSLGAFILNLVLNIILIPKFGAMGAAWATLISLTALGIARVIEIQFLMKLSFLSTQLFKPLFAGLVTWFCLVCIRSFVIGYHTIVTLSLVLLCTILVYGFVLWLLHLEPEDKDFFSGLVILKGGQEKRS